MPSVSGLTSTPLPLFAGLFAALGLAWWIGKHTTHGIIPSNVDGTWSPVAEFYRHRGGDPQGDVELGGAWTSALDPGAAIRLSWIAGTGELVAFRHQAKATLRYNPVGIFGLGNVPSMNRHAEGMKVLTRTSLRQVQTFATPALARAPDGLDQLTAALGHPYLPPEGTAVVPAEPPARPDRAVRSAADAERHERLVSSIPTIASVVGLMVIATAILLGSASIGASAAPVLLALAVVVAAAALATTTGNFAFSKALLRRTHRHHDDHRRGRPR
jgi:hypothetical protein